ncbi:MAG: hypothetical protein QXL17_08290 [Candidatus Thermoplasmatota archaeon]
MKTARQKFWFSLLLIVLLSLSVFFISGCVQNDIHEKNNDDTNIPNHQTQQVSVKETGSFYKTAPKGLSGWFQTGQDADIMLSGIDFNNTGGPLLFNHPSGIVTDGKRLFLADTFNNRVLIWNTLPTDNVPPDLVLGQKDFIANDPGTGRDKFNWPFGIATDGKHLVVSDVNNARILIWNTIPTENGTSADIVLEGGGSFWTAQSERNLPGASWGVWTNGEKLVVSNTWSGDTGTILIWNTFPSRDNQPADLVLTGKGNIGTPRHITSDGNSLIVGDHNAKNEGESHGSFFWKNFPTSDQPYDFFMSKGFGWLRGTFLNDGRLLLIGGNEPKMRIWNTFPQNRNDEADVEIELSDAKLWGHDYEGVAVTNDAIYFSQGNQNRVIGYRMIPITNNQRPDFVIGSPDVSTNTLETNFFIQNGVPASDGNSLFVVSDFDRKLYVWKNLPDESGAHPDLVYSFDKQPIDIALHDHTLAIAGEDTVYIWKNLPTDGHLPDVILQGNIGSVQLEAIKGVAMDERHFYISDHNANKVYVWEGLPDKSSNPKTVINVNGPWRIDSDGKYLIVDSIFESSSYIYDPTQLSDIPISKVGGPGKLNLPQSAIISNNHLFIADSGFGRVLIWNDVEKAISGQWPPDIILGQSNIEGKQPAIGRNRLFNPAGLSFDGSYLWVGEFKFSNRLLRFSVR